jgi:hypothetical protein
MKRKDWMLLRVLRIAIRQNPTKTRCNRDIVLTTLYLLNKYGKKELNRCIDALANEERIYAKEAKVHATAR